MITKNKAIEIMVNILNEMPVDAEVGYRTEIGDKFREAIYNALDEQEKKK